MSINVQSVTSSKLSDVGVEASRRPERRFELRRFLWIILIVLVVLACAVIFLSNCLNPTRGVGSLGGVKRVDAASVSMTPTAEGFLGGRSGSFPSPNPVTVTPVGKRSLGVECWMLVDTLVGSVFLPVLSKIYVTGFTRARGGMVQIVGVGWVSQGLVRCDGDLQGLEVAYTETVEPTPMVTKRRVVFASPTPVPSATAIPTAVRSIRFDGNCLVFAIDGVREIWVNGMTPVVGGSTICDVHEFRVLVK